MKRNIVSAALAGVVLFSAFSVPTVGFAAGAQKTETGVIPARTINNFVTGAVTYQDVSIDKYQQSVDLKGIVVIDGPQLVLELNGVNVSADASIVKIADKTWSYSYHYSFNGQVGDIPVAIHAYTIFVNGKTAGNVHTDSATATQIVHVPYVQSFAVKELSWDGYDPVSNLIYYTYILTKVWDDGTEVDSVERIASSVEGTETAAIYGSDVTHDGGNPVLVQSIVPPVYYRSYEIISTPESYVWSFDSDTNTYSVSFQIRKLYSDNSTVIETIVINGLVPDSLNTKSVVIEGQTYELQFIAPAAPTVEPKVVAPSVSNVQVVITEIERIANNASQNNVRVHYGLVVTLSDGTSFSANDFAATVPLNGGNSSGSKNISVTVNYNGTDYSLNFTVNVVL